MMNVPVGQNPRPLNTVFNTALSPQPSSMLDMAVRGRAVARNWRRQWTLTGCVGFSFRQHDQRALNACADSVVSVPPLCSQHTLKSLCKFEDRCVPLLRREGV